VAHGRTLKLQDKNSGTFTYDACFDEDATCEEVYNLSGKDRILSAMQVSTAPLQQRKLYGACLASAGPWLESDLSFGWAWGLEGWCASLASNHGRA